MKLSAAHTVRAGYIGYLTQAITINFAPLLFITFENTYNISLGKISLLIAISFLTQLAADIFWAKFSDRLNPRAGAILAHVLAVLGMTGFAYLPDLLPSPYLGLMLSVMLAAVGGGIIEVLISPIVEACPTEEKSSAMSLLHSFYSWGLAGVVLLSTLFFSLVGIEHWRILSCLWAIVPAVGAIAFCVVPIYTLETAAEDGDVPAPTLWRSGSFWIFFLMMFCAGAAEQAMGQWASSFAESGLGVSKTLGDLLGPCLFAILMGTARVVYGRSGGRIDLRRFIVVSSILCIVSYLLAALSPYPLLSLAGCALCGLSVGILWPGTYSLASARLPYGGVRMFALLAMAGDIGCLAGPTAAGWIAEACGNNMKVSFLISILFPALILFMCYLGFRRKSR
ncbi:MAG: MFS transporter [Ruminococcaceae bacterium]|nr:MFS transporter [Oscillospiraceae bacterium]